MNLHQIRFVRETVKQDFSLTQVAKALFTSQSGVSKAIIELEQELGFQIFQRYGKRIRGLTLPGELVLQSCERVLAELENIKRVGQEFSAGDSGRLTVAVTHTQARYVLPGAVAAFRQRFPKVKLVLKQGTPDQLVDWVGKDIADLAVATEALANEPKLITLPCFQWGHVVIAPKKSSILAPFIGDSSSRLAINDFEYMPLITYEAHFAGRSKIDNAFKKANIQPDVILEAIDADVIKTYVQLGLGVGIIADLAFDAQKDSDLVAVSASHLFGFNTTRIALRRGAFMRSVIYEFITLFSPSLTTHVVNKALQGGQSYEI